MEAAAEKKLEKMQFECLTMSTVNNGSGLNADITVCPWVNKDSVGWIWINQDKVCSKMTGINAMAFDGGHCESSMNFPTETE